MVEHAAVNRGVVGSSPTRGGKGKPVNVCVYRSFFGEIQHHPATANRGGDRHLMLF